MAITVDQATIGENASNVASTTIVLTTSAAVASGATIVLGLGWSVVGVLQTVTGGGLTWAINKEAVNGNDHSAIVSAYAPSGVASSTAITATWDNSSTVGKLIGAMSFNGVKSTSPLDGTPVSATQATAAWSTGNIVTSASAVIVAVSEIDQPLTVTATAPSVESFDVTDAVGGNSLCLVYRIESSASTYTVQGTWSSGGTGSVVGAAYLEATAEKQSFYASRRRTVAR